jgi:ABC-2 type transport system permease protein
MHAAWIIAVKDLRQLVRDRMSCFFAFVFPLAIAVLFGTIFGQGGGGGGDEGPQKIDVLLVDEDGTEGSRRFAQTLRDAAELAITDSPSRDEATGAVRAGKSAACVVIPKGFGEARENMFWAGAGSALGLGVDPSRRAEAGMLEGILTKYGFMQMQEMFQDPAKMRDQLKTTMDKLRRSDESPLTKRVFERFYGDLDTFMTALPEVQDQPTPNGPAPAADATDKPKSDTPAGFQPIRIEKLEIAPRTRNGPPNSYAITFPQGVIWGVMGCALGFAVGLVTERTGGTMIRLRVAPLTRTQILGGKALACFIATLAVSWLVLLVGVLFMGIRPNSWPLLALATLCISICFVGIMMLLAVFGQSERGGNSLGWGVLLILSMIGGGMIPYFFMPGWMKTLSIISPISWSIRALDGALWRDFTAFQMLTPCLILTVIGVVGFGLGARILGRSQA